MKWYEYNNLMSWDKDDLATTIIELVDDIKEMNKITKKSLK